MKTLKVIKIGGNIIDDVDALDEFIENFSKIKAPKILVHGGGKSASHLTRKMNIDVKMTNGRRITDAETLDIVTMVYAGKINKNITAKLQSNKCNAMGFSGADANTIVSVKRPVSTVDFGFVGDVIKINTRIVHLLLEHSITPVFCAITHNGNGQLLNTNADTIASELAGAFTKEYKTELYYCFEKNGVLRDVQNNDSVIERINTKNYQRLIDEQIINDGMLPKLINCFNAIKKNVSKVCIGNSNMLFDTSTKFTTIQK